MLRWMARPRRLLRPIAHRSERLAGPELGPSWLRWLVNFGLSLSGADCALGGQRPSRCPLLTLNRVRG
ncbi:MAG TPA: hypothetical protein VFV27_02005 [Nevskiaceae bacterium]|nr:hypothetical protein [Nevskiaceae bacterium]